jgi:eukaryotic-like serine/threonine-protein kinase
MRSRHFLSILTIALTTACLFATAAQKPAGTATAGFQGTGPLLGQGEDVGAPPMKLRWQYKTNNTDRAEVVGSPVIVKDTVYVADTKGALHALDIKTGADRWHYLTEDSFETTPLVMNGNIYIGDLIGVFHAVGADGKKLWSVDTEVGIHASANGVGDKILFGNDGAELICLNAVDGKEVWKVKAGDRINSAPSIGNGLGFFTGCDAQLRAIDIEKGEERFAADMGALSGGSPALVGDKLVIGTDGGRVICVDVKTQKIDWTYEQVESGAMVFASPSVADGVVVVGARDRFVHAIDLATGQRKWAYKTRGEVDAAATISGGRVYVGSKDRRMYVFDLKSGKLLWDFQAERSIEAAPAIASGVVVLADTAGNVFCLEPVK